MDEGTSTTSPESTLRVAQTRYTVIITPRAARVTYQWGSHSVLQSSGCCSIPVHPLRLQSIAKTKTWIQGCRGPAFLDCAPQTRQGEKTRSDSVEREDATRMARKKSKSLPY